MQPSVWETAVNFELEQYLGDDWWRFTSPQEHKYRQERILRNGQCQALITIICMLNRYGIWRSVFCMLCTCFCVCANLSLICDFRAIWMIWENCSCRGRLMFGQTIKKVTVKWRTWHASNPCRDISSSTTKCFCSARNARRHLMAMRNPPPTVSNTH